MSGSDGWNLTADAAKALTQSDTARIDFLKQDRWIGYPAASKIIMQLDELVSYPKSTRMPNIAIVGRPDNGKSSLVKRFIGRHPVIDAMDGLHIPVVSSLMPSVPDEAGLWSALLSKLQVSHRPTAPVRSLRNQVYRVLAGMYARVLVIDEFHHLNSSAFKQQEGVLAALKNLSSDLKLCLVIVGTRDLVGALRADSQLATRFKPLALNQWTLGETTSRFLATFEMQLPLKERSYLGGSSLTQEILSRAEGTIGGMKNVLLASAKAAIEAGEERITRDIVRRVDVVTAIEYDKLLRSV